MSNIKIGVACHKPSVLPNNALFMPIQVGSKNAKNRMNMAHDDEGDNISEKNPFYCELTAQYWLWKNQEADYYGLCHYRRYLCFEKVNNARINERKQIVGYALDDYNIKKYGLDNEEKMREIIEQNDAVVGELEEVSRLYTPRGSKRTAMAHWRAHHRALIMNEDLDKMLEIFEKKYPSLGSDAREYLNTNTFLGFNCFVMKKEMFNEMCEIEFSVLQELEKYVDLSHYCQQLTRIYGFMGEIICSAYIYHLEKKNHKIKHVPLVYFEYTDEEKQIEPLKKGSLPVVFVNEDAASFKFAITLRSFLDHINIKKNYDIIALINNPTSALKNKINEMCTEYKNVNIRFLDVNHYYSIMKDRTKEIMSITPYIPWILPKYNESLVFGPDIIFNDSVDELWNEKIDKGNIIAAPYHVLMQARCNDIYEKTEEQYLTKQVKDVYNFSYVDVMKLDYNAYRQIGAKYIWEHRLNSFEELRNATELINVVCEGKIKNINQKWAVWTSDDVYQSYQLPYAPTNLYLNLLSAQKNPSIYVYLPDDPWFITTTTTNMLYWEIAKRTPVYARCLDYMMVFKSHVHEEKDVLNKWFPREGKMRSTLSQIIPKGSRRHKAAKKVLSKFGMK